MIRKFTSLSRKIRLILLVIVIAVGASLYVSAHRTKPVATNGLPEYFNLGNNYLFKIPKTYSVDAQSVLGAELIYSTPISAKTLEEVYSQNGIAVQALNLTYHSSKSFKDYVKNTYIPDLKKNLSTGDVKVKFAKANGSDNARITVKKDGQQIRFIYLKDGQHPASVLSKSETDNFKVIEQTITDVENSDLKTESSAIKQSIQNIVQLAKTQKAQELYSAASPELRSKTSQDTLTSALKTASSFLDQKITIGGGSYSQASFSAIIRFTSSNQDNPQSVPGAILLKKIDGQWKLQALSLPTPTPKQ